MTSHNYSWSFILYMIDHNYTWSIIAIDDEWSLHDLSRTSMISTATRGNWVAYSIYLSSYLLFSGNDAAVFRLHQFADDIKVYCRYHNDITQLYLLRKYKSPSHHNILQRQLLYFRAFFSRKLIFHAQKQMNTLKRNQTYWYQSQKTVPSFS